MVEMVHQVPGRLRIRILGTKGNPGEAARVKARIESMRGVCAATVNAVTGSVVIHYDPRTTRVEAIAAGLQLDAVSAAAMPGLAGLKPVARRIGQRLARSLIETLLERSAMALIAAL
jgi:hypothetical protein